jgi:mannose-1-phosphate guanylyltransferase
LSRKRRAKQLLALDGKHTMIQQTVARLAPMAAPDRFWIITNDDLRSAILRQLPKLPAKQVVAEPAGRNTAPAIGLAAFLLLRRDPDAVLGLFPSDHVIAEPAQYRETLGRGIEIAAAGENIVVLGIRPTRPETGYGYIEAGAANRNGTSDLSVRRFTEKPDLATARQFLDAGNYFWNSGMFVWSARTLANAVRELLPETAPLLEEIAAAWDTPEFDRVFADLYPKCENISVDYAILEPRSAKGEHHSHLYCIPARFGWSDLGSWAALHEYQVERKAADAHSNVLDAIGSVVLSSKGNYVFSPDKFVALVGVEDLVVVETDDALLITTRHHSQDVGKVVKELAERGQEKLI